MDIQVFIAGFVGALAPEIVRLYELRQSPQTFQPWYYAISVVYALLGGYVATLLPGVADGPLWWAFAVGAGLNAVVSLAAKLGAQLAGGGAGRVTPPGGPPPAASARELGEAAPAKGTMGDFWRAL